LIYTTIDQNYCSLSNTLISTEIIFLKKVFKFNFFGWEAKRAKSLAKKIIFLAKSKKTLCEKIISLAKKYLLAKKISLGEKIISLAKKYLLAKKISLGEKIISLAKTKFLKQKTEKT